MRRVLILFFVVITLFTCACRQNESISLNNDNTVDVSAQQSSVISITEINGTAEGVFKIARSLPPLSVFEDKCFYAYNDSGELFRIIYEGDMTFLSESIEVYVRYADIKKIAYCEPLMNSWMPEYEVTAGYVGLVAKSH